MPRRDGLPIFLLLLAIWCTAAAAMASSPSQDRQRFLDAEQALERGDATAFRRLRAELGDYPLIPYLDYADLSGRLATASETEVAGFIDRYQDTPLASRMRGQWLDHLAAQRRWAEYLTLYAEDGNVSRQCYRLQAKLETGQADLALPEVSSIWLHGRSQPKACDPVFAAWAGAGQRTGERVWQRIEKAMAAGEWRLANYLKRYLPAAERPRVDRWVELYRDPMSLAAGDTDEASHPYREVMLAQVVRRLARRDGAAAMTAWQRLRERYRFDATLARETEQYILRNLVRDPGDAVYRFVASVEVGPGDADAHEARILAALQREDWPRVRDWIAALPAETRGEARWHYWYGRALQAMGDGDGARAAFTEAAGERSYYGFLAADQVGADYHLVHAETPVLAADLEAIARLGGIERARELFALERWYDGRREWHWATRELPTPLLKAAAKLAQQEGWHDRAIFTLARTGYWDDLELRFPLEHVDLVEYNARQHGIETEWIFAVMRQESAFMRKARSHAGAMGLMQLMPATARHVAKDLLKRKPPRRAELYLPETNIALGSAYLKQMQAELGGSSVLATAAYNAGPHRVMRWLPQRTLPADIWIELVPFDETRGYLRRVLAYRVIYASRMGRAPQRLQELMHPVGPRIELIGDNRELPGRASAG